MKKEKRSSLIRKFGTISGIGITLITLVLISYAVYRTRTKAIESERQKAVAIAQIYSGNVQIILERAMDASRTMAEALSMNGDPKTRGSLPRQTAIKMGEKILLQEKDFLGFTMAFEPDAFDGKDRQHANSQGHDASGRFIPYITKGEDGTTFTEPLLDYDDQAKAPWYWEPKNRMKEYLTEPIIYPVNGVDVLMVSCMAPVIHNDQFMGVVGIDYPIDFIQEMVSNRGYYEGNYHMSIVSHHGVYVANNTDPKLINHSLKEVYPGSFEHQLQKLQKGEPTVEITGGNLEISGPLYVGKTEEPWQVRFSVPYHIIASEANQQMWVMIVMGILLGGLAIFAITYFVKKAIVKNLLEITEFAAILAKGNLTIDVPDYALKINDEFGLLAKAFQELVLKLRTTVNGVVVASNNVASASQQLSSGSQQVSQGANEQASGIEEVSSAMEEMAANIQQNTESAQQAAAIAKQAEQEMLDLGQLGSSAVAAMRTVAEKITVIGEIANQTNILALNAAVEAARAGAQGRGFAVVAAEVRKLAERSQQASKEIDQISKHGVVANENTGAKVMQLIPMIQKNAQLVQEIAAASYEQTSGVEQVNSAIQQLNQVTQQNAAASEEMASSAEELSSQADQMKEIVNFFDVGQTTEINITTKKPVTPGKKVQPKAGHFIPELEPTNGYEKY